MEKKIWVYSGTFDPFTTGHLDIVERAAKLCDQLIIAVSDHRKKNTVFTIEERLKMILLTIAHYDNIKVMKFDHLLADFCRENQAQAIVRGIRNQNDLTYETPMATINHQLAEDLESGILSADRNLTHISASNYKELANYTNDYLNMIPECNIEFVRKKFENRE